MRKITIYGLTVVVLFCILNFTVKALAVTSKNFKPIERSTEELYQDIYLTLLDPYIQKAVDKYYEPYFKDSPEVAPYMVDVLNIDRPNGYRTFEFIIEVQVMPYFGPHNDIGVDNITLKISAGNEVQIEKFEHIKSFELPWNYQYEIINKWP